MLNAGRETRQTIDGQKEAKGDFSTGLDANEIFHFPFHISYFSFFILQREFISKCDAK